MQTNDFSVLPVGDAPKALTFDHFPTRFQAVIWRNWNLLPAARIATVLHCTEQQVIQAGMDMGLEQDDSCLARWEERGFQTIIRRNWELLDYPQLVELIQWTPEHLAFILKEDDFFFVKLGWHKPACEKVYYRELTADEAKRTAEIKKTVLEIKKSLPPRTEKPFDFLDHYGQFQPTPDEGRFPQFKDNFIYAYSALYGDALLQDDLDSYPEAMMKDYAASGVKGVWLQGVLYTLVPWLGDNLPCSDQWQRRLKNLKKLAQRAAKYGLKVYLYINEPRSMPADFFKDHPDWKGTEGETGDFALCTSAPGVLEALTAGIERLFREVPELGGIFTITMSENLTHCRSRGACCPRCESHSAAELIAGVNKAILTGIRRAGSQAPLIANCWAWNAEWIPEIVQRMGPEIHVLAISERHLPTDIFGFKSEVDDYSISKVGPGEEALNTWKVARAAGNPCAAKIQVNASWELSAVPYIPVPDLVDKHFERLANAGVQCLMLSWTLGGSPGGNLPLLKCSRQTLATSLYGTQAANQVMQAWTTFSNAFEKYLPYNNVAVLYFAPQNFGPMTLLHKTPSGRAATMIGFPNDAIDYWRGARLTASSRPTPDSMSKEILRDAFRTLSNEWSKGVQILLAIPTPTDPTQAKNLQELITIAQACDCHFLTTADQIDYVMARDAKQDIMPFVQRERQTAIRLLELMRRDSRIGYEASNHYFYTENDLLEKVLNIETF